jgi:hypothetical protein
MEPTSAQLALWLWVELETMAQLSPSMRPLLPSRMPKFVGGVLASAMTQTDGPPPPMVEVLVVPTVTGPDRNSRASVTELLRTPATANDRPSRETVRVSCSPPAVLKLWATSSARSVR